MSGTLFRDTSCSGRGTMWTESSAMAQRPRLVFWCPLQHAHAGDMQPSPAGHRTGFVTWSLPGPARGMNLFAPGPGFQGSLVDSEALSAPRGAATGACVVPAAGSVCRVDTRRLRSRAVRPGQDTCFSGRGLRDFDFPSCVWAHASYERNPLTRDNQLQPALPVEEEK